MANIPQRMEASWLYRLVRQPAPFPRLHRLWQFGVVAACPAIAERLWDGKE